MRNFVLLTLLVLFCGFGASAQNQKVSGVVTGEDGAPVAGVTVVVKGTSTGTISDAKGNYSINAAKDAVLVFSYIGMKTQDVAVNNRTHINVVMAHDAMTLDEVVVTGYGVTRKAAFTGSAQVVGKDLVTSKTDANFMKSLQGSVAGLQMYNVSGQPGAFAAVNIRGVGSVNSGTEPLYIIDGMPMYSDATSALNGSTNGAMYTSPMSNINPDDIESVTVLKDATATAIYGARAANGVIVITTKRGVQGAPKVNFTAKKGFTTASNLDHKYRTVNTEGYLDMWAKGFVNAGKAYIPGYEGVFDMPATTYEQGLAAAKRYSGLMYGWEEGVTPDTDWLQEILRTGQVDDYSMNVSGGTSNATYYLGGGYFRNEGIVIGTGVDRYTLRANIEAKSKRFTFGMLSSAAYSETNNTVTQSQYINPLVAVYDLRPIEPVYNPDGTYNENAYYNPVMIADKDKNLQRNITANINPYVSIDFGKGFYAKSSFAMNVYNLKEDGFTSKYNPQGTAANGKKQEYNYTYLNMTITNTVNWMKRFDKHNVNLMLGQEAQRMRDEELYAAAQNFPFDGVIDMETAAKPTGATSAKTQSTLSSFFFNGQYDYADKYYLSGSLRYDGSSRFGKDNRWGLFYSIGGKYRISAEEFFMPLTKVINNLTLRASYGTVGNQDIGWYSARGVYRAGYSYNELPGARPYRIANDGLTWESRNKFNVGFDMTLFDRISVELDYYNEKTTDMLFDMPISMTTGLSSVFQNVGEMKNSGIEALVRANIIRTKDWSWDVNFNITHNKNEIVKLSTSNPVIGTYTIRKPGEAYHTFYMKDYAGVNPDTGVAQWYKGTEGNELTESYNEAGYRVVGKADPKFYGGFGTDLKYKGFDLNLNFSYSYGGKVLNSGFTYDMQNGDYFLGPISNYIYENAWTPENRNTDVPIFKAYDRSGASKLSTRFLMDGSYLRLKSATLGYTFPKSICNKIKLDNLRVFVSGDNLFTARSKDFIGFDPETRQSGLQQWVYPMATNVMFGLTFGF